jgi:group I intron endonuclease
MIHSIDYFLHKPQKSKIVYGVIYKIVNKITQKVYYGQTRQPPSRRWSQHKGDAKKTKKNDALHNAMHKYGINNFTFTVIETCESLDEMNKREEFHIAKNNTLAPNGYNLAKGGNNYEKHPSTCQKISNANKGRVMSQEWCQNIANAHRGRKNTADTIEKMKVAQKGRVITQETREKLRAINLGKKQNADTIAKKSAARKGVPWSEKKRQSMIGYQHSEETKQKMSTTQKGRQFSNETKQKMREAKQAVRKLTDQQIQEIRENKDNLPQCQLATQYNVSKQLINNVVTYKRGYEN